MGDGMGKVIDARESCETPSMKTKPLLAVEQQIGHLKSKGVTFDICDENTARSYLSEANNYLRVASYRKLYARQVEGNHIGNYINLDFANLVDLAALDRQLREAFLLAAIDIEHFAKVKVLRCAEGHTEDGYAIVADFLGSLNHAERNRLNGSFKMRSREGEGHDTYSGDLIAHYLGDMPLWVMLEVIEFGAFVNLYLFCARRWQDAEMEQEHYVLKSVKALRNACAHNSCIVNGLTSEADIANYPTNSLILKALNEAGIRNSKSRRTKLKNLRIAQMTAALFALSTLCTRETTRARHAKRFASLRELFEAKRAQYRDDNPFVSFFDFLWKLVDVWVPKKDNTT